MVPLYLTSRDSTIVVGGILAPQCEHTAETQHEQPEQPARRGGWHQNQANKRGLSSHCSAKKLSPVLATETRSGWVEKYRETKAPPSESQQDEERKRGKRTEVREKAMYNTNRRSPPLRIIPAAVADQLSPYASCTVTPAPSQAGRQSSWEVHSVHHRTGFSRAPLSDRTLWLPNDDGSTRHLIILCPESAPSCPQNRYGFPCETR